MNNKPKSKPETFKAGSPRLTGPAGAPFVIKSTLLLSIVALGLNLVDNNEPEASGASEPNASIVRRYPRLADTLPTQPMPIEADPDIGARVSFITERTESEVIHLVDEDNSDESITTAEITDPDILTDDQVTHIQSEIATNLRSNTLRDYIIDLSPVELQAVVNVMNFNVNNLENARESVPEASLNIESGMRDLVNYELPSNDYQDDAPISEEYLEYFNTVEMLIEAARATNRDQDLSNLFAFVTDSDFVHPNDKDRIILAISNNPSKSSRLTFVIFNYILNGGVSNHEIASHILLACLTTKGISAEILLGD